MVVGGGTGGRQADVLSPAKRITGKSSSAHSDRARTTSRARGALAFITDKSGAPLNSVKNIHVAKGTQEGGREGGDHMSRRRGE